MFALIAVIVKPETRSVRVHQLVFIGRPVAARIGGHSPP